jgi:tRNA(Ile)-lysidine synthase
MLSKLARKVEAYIGERGLLDSGDNVVVAVSGGPDSLALLAVLGELKGRYGWGLSAAHVNHGLRGVGSDADEKFVARFCGEREVPLETARLREGSLAGEGNLENRLRRLRYDSLAHIAARLNAALATGHTLNDQAETLLMKLVRGSGPGGLSGIAVKRFHRDPETGGSVRVIRPLLEVARAEILSYLATAGLDYRIDETNLDQGYDRNWVRIDLIPKMEERLNPRLLEVLGRSAALFREIDVFLVEAAKGALKELGESTPDGSAVSLCFRRLADLPAAIRKVVVREAFGRVRGDLADLTLAHVEAVLRLAGTQSGRRVQLPGGITAIREFDRLWLGRRRELPPFRRGLALPGEIWIPEVGRRVVASLCPEDSAHFRATAPTVSVRNRRPGDRYRPAPGARERRLKKLLVEMRVPFSRRDELLIFEEEGRILWVEGFPAVGSRAGTGIPVAIRVLDETFNGTASSNS